MRDIKIRGKFKKELRVVSNYPEYNEKLLDEYIQMLQRGEKLPEKVRDHKLSKSSSAEYKDCREFHLSPDLLVVYRLFDDKIELVSIGKHNTLRLTSSLKFEGRVIS